MGHTVCLYFILLALVLSALGKGKPKEDHIPRCYYRECSGSYCELAPPSGTFLLNCGRHSHTDPAWLTKDTMGGGQGDFPYTNMTQSWDDVLRSIDGSDACYSSGIMVK